MLAGRFQYLKQASNRDNAEALEQHLEQRLKHACLGEIGLANFARFTVSR